MKQPSDSFLAHYGVLGMKWGKRSGNANVNGGSVKKKAAQLTKDQIAKDKKLAKDQKAYDKNVNANWWKAHNEAAAYANDVLIPQINKKYEKFDFTKSDIDPKIKAVEDKYFKEYDEGWEKVMNTTMDQMFGKRPGS